MKRPKAPAHPGFLLLFLLYAPLAGIGGVDGMFGVAWPTMRQGFGVPIDAIGLAMAFGTTGYLLCSFFVGRLLARFAVHHLLAFSCTLVGLSFLGNCLVPSWTWFAALGLTVGFGAGGIDAGLNTYVALRLGEREMHWLHACYGLGATLGPWFMTAILNAFGDWRPAYWIMGPLQLAIAGAYVLTGPKWKKFDRGGGKGSQGREPARRKLTGHRTPMGETLRHGPSWAGMLLFFLYSGAEVGLGLWSYTILTESRGVATTLAGILMGGFFGFFTVGRILSGFFIKKISTRRLLLGSLFLALAGAILLWANLGPLPSFVSIILTGFVIAPVFPCLVSSTQARVGARHAGNTIGMQMAAAGTGAAALPSLMGVLARRVSLEAIPVVIVALFALILGLFFLATRKEEK
ncbi:MAG TPA: MFS transporter [bacterium]|nr:MFS transporter [bacterium]